MYNLVSDWIDEILEEDIPEEIVAFCFNLYEDGDGNWSMELVGTERFEEEDDEWPCDEITDFETREEPLTWNKEEDWETVLEQVVDTLNLYLEKGKYANILKSKSGIGVGFVDGDIRILYSK